MIPRRILFGNPERARARISPSGELLGFLAPIDGVLGVWVGPAVDPRQAAPVAEASGHGIFDFTWAYTSEHVIYSVDTAGDERWRLYSASVADSSSTRLTPSAGAAARLVGASHRFPEQILVGINEPDSRFFDLYRVDVASGDRTLILENDRFFDFVADCALEPRVALAMDRDGSVDYFHRRPAVDWEPLDSFPMEDALASRPIGLDEDGDLLYLVDSRVGDTGALVAVDLDTGDRRELAQDDLSEVDQVMVHPTTRRVQAVSFTHLRSRWEALDESIGPSLAHLREASDGEIEVTSRSRDDAHWIVAATSDVSATRYYHYSRLRQQLSFLFASQPALEGWGFAEMRPVSIRSRDGLELVSYLTLPAESDDRGTESSRQLPMVVLVHGGPWTRDRWGFDPRCQWLADRGYAVLSVNYRGSTGFGRKFLNAGNFEWAGRMHDDVVDAVEWAVKAGVADAERVGIMGMSYGGYETLVALAFTPELFACGVDLAGPSNLMTFLESVPADWEPQIALFTSRIGDHRTPEGREWLMRHSPASRVGQIRRPLLIAQGDGDPRVKSSESERVVRDLTERGVPVTYLFYPDEGHGFLGADNRLSYFAAAEAFLASHLGGRAEPPGDELQRSSIQIRAGAEHTPSLATALSDGAPKET